MKLTDSLTCSLMKFFKIDLNYSMEVKSDHKSIKYIQCYSKSFMAWGSCRRSRV